MANAHKGEVELEADGKTYKFSYSMNALCELEEKTGRSFTQILADLGDRETTRMITVRAVFWAGLRDHHPDMTIEDAGRLLTIAGFASAHTIIEQAVARSFPQGKEVKTSDGPLANPARLNG